MHFHMPFEILFIVCSIIADYTCHLNQHFFCHVKLAGALMTAYMYVYLYVRMNGGNARRCKSKPGHTRAYQKVRALMP